MFLPIPHHLFFSKNDSEDIRLGDLATVTNLEQVKKNDFVIFGYPDDEGIKLNGGRPGASEGPNIIRQFFYKMTPSYKSSAIPKKIYDYGNLAITTSNLAARHEVARNHVAACLKKQARVICLGGGHDYGFSDTAAFVDAFHHQSDFKPLIINFDAHLDVRPLKSAPHSGTPFFRLCHEHPQKFDLIEIGIQTQCNSPHHVKWAKDQDIEIIDLESLEQTHWEIIWTKTKLKNLHPDQPVFVSFDIDALTAAEAGGCSQAWATGLKIADCLSFLNHLYTKSNVRGLGIYEVSPPLDRDFQTSKTAALLMHHFIYHSK